MHVINILELVTTTLSQRGRENGYDSKDGELKETTAEERSAGKIAEIFNMLSGRDLTAAEAWLFLISLKLARLQSQLAQGKDVSDNVVDLVAYCGLWGEEITNAKEPTKEPTKEHTAQDELRKVAKILSGSDAPGEIRALTVTAQSYVDRLATMAAARTTLSAESWANLEKLMVQPSSPARELIELMARGTMKDDAIRSAITHATARFICNHESYEELDPGNYRCCDCNEYLTRKDLPNAANIDGLESEAKPCQHNHIVSTHLGRDFAVTSKTEYRCLDCGETGPVLAAINENFRAKS